MQASSHFEADPLTREIIAAAIEVHKSLGPGPIESIYEEALCYEFYLRGIEFQRQIRTDVIYKGRIIKGQRIRPDNWGRSHHRIEVSLANSRSGIRANPILSESHQFEAGLNYELWREETC